MVKRQRYCQATALGAYLCTQFNFLIFIHEFIIVLKKAADLEQHDRFFLSPDVVPLDAPVLFTSQCRRMPSSPIERKSVVMGTIWTFLTDKSTLDKVAMARLVSGLVLIMSRFNGLGKMI